MKTPAVAIVAILGIASLTAQNSADDLRTLYRARQWFDLRRATSVSSPLFLRAVVASRFNEPGAESLLRQVIRDHPRSDDANTAHNLLTQMYLRTGQFRRMNREIAEWAATLPDRPELREAQKDARLFRDLPDQNTGVRRRAQLRHDPGETTLPVTMNGRRAEWLFDTGAWISVVSADEATRLGMTVREQRTALSDGINDGNVRTAVARELTVGSTHFRDVSFAVIDGVENFGILGIQVLTGLGRVDWSKNGGVEVGGAGPAIHTDASNLVFDGNHLLLRLGVLGKDVLALFDTGAQMTDLTGNFAKAFPEAVGSAEKTTRDLTGFAGTRTAEAVRIPELVFSIGPRTVALRPAEIVLENFPGLGADCCIGNAGRDLLTQGQGFTIDLTSMTLAVN